MVLCVFAITGAQPIIPLVIIEANYLQPSPNSILSTTDLIARRAIALQECSDNLKIIFKGLQSSMQSSHPFSENTCSYHPQFQFQARRSCPYS